MDQEQDYFPTKAYKLASAKMQALLNGELKRLEKLGPLSVEVCKKTLPEIIQFTEQYHKAFMNYLNAVLPQHKNGIQCGPNCGNCCRHYPMSIEPFEQIAFYNAIRKREDLFSILESCLARTKNFAELLEKSQTENPQPDDPEENALHAFFEQNFPCPFLLKSGSCGIYEHRPVTCRMYFSETPKEFCTAEFLQTKNNRSFIVYLPDIIEETIADISHYYENLNLSESLYEGILELNSLDGELFV